MSENIINIPQMLMIGSTGRNSGKTTLATEFIRRWKGTHNIIGLKVTSVLHRDGTCPRGGHGCGACSNLCGDFEIIEETNAHSQKDTSLLLAAGCTNVYWLKVMHPSIADGFSKFLEKVPSGALIVCESNSLRRFVKPGIFIMLDNEKSGNIKDTAQKVITDADCVIKSDIRDYAAYIIDDIIIDTKPVLKMLYLNEARN